MSCTAQHAELALSVARDLGRDTEGAEFALDSLAIGMRRGGARVELGSVSRLCASSRTVTRCCCPTSWPPARAILQASRWSAAAAAQRARLAVEVVGVAERLYLAHPGATLVVDPASGEILDGHELGVDLLWRCAHEVVATVLDRVAERAERTGDLALAMAARAVTLDAPARGRFARVSSRRASPSARAPELGRADLALGDPPQADRQG